MNEKVLNIIFLAVQELNEELNDPRLEQVNEQTPLYGVGGVLKSLSLVNLITEIEDKVQDEFGKEIILANEKALSQNRSPFSNIATLAQYIDSLLLENVHG
jgi:acyl carrier protein